MYKSSTQGFGVVEVLLGIVLIAVVGFVVWQVTKTDETVSDTSATTSSDSGISKTSKDNGTQTPDSMTEKDERGTVRGRASYPSESKPDDYMVCARAQDSGEDTCTNEFTGDGLDFELDLPVGKYIVYAVSDDNEYVAYHDQCSVTDAVEDCPSENPNTVVVIAVMAGDTVSDIKPNSWYGPEDARAFFQQ